jgi:hypothetical protein
MIEGRLGAGKISLPLINRARFAPNSGQSFAAIAPQFSTIVPAQACLTGTGTMWRAISTKAIQLTALFLLIFLSACAIFEELPPPDPIWSAVATTEGVVYAGSGRFVDESGDHRAASQRAYIYLQRYLPATKADFIRSLRQQHFSCVDTGSGTKCSYTNARPPEPCLLSVRVSIEVSFPDGPSQTKEITGKDIDVVALMTPDEESADDRGCFPL